MVSQYASRLNGLDAPSVWHEFTPLAQEHKAVNLGQGFPDWPCADFLKKALTQATHDDFNQYTRSGGHIPLVERLAKRYTTVIGREMDPMTNVTVTVGASEALFGIFQAFVNPGDEVLMIEPAFDLYIAQTKMAGGTPKFVPLRLVEDSTNANATKRWQLDPVELEAKITPQTKLLILNTPHNPTGKTFSRDEFEELAQVLRRHPHVKVVSDEVYEHMTYDNRSHVQFASLDGMWERTLTVSSAGKTFSVTGWKVGWVVGPEDLVKGVMLANTWIQFTVATPLQHAIALAFDEADKEYEGYENYYAWLKAQYIKKRKDLTHVLEKAGLNPITPEGGFFIMADTSAINIPEKYLQDSTPACPKMTRDWAFCRWLTIEKGVAAIPPSAFYQEEDKPLAANLARFAFCKTDEAIQLAAERLSNLNDS